MFGYLQFSDTFIIGIESVENKTWTHINVDSETLKPKNDYKNVDNNQKGL